MAASTRVAVDANGTTDGTDQCVVPASLDELHLLAIEPIGVLRLNDERIYVS